MKKTLLIAGLLALSSQAYAIGLTQTAVAATVLPTATISASIFGVEKQVLYKDGVEYIMQAEIDMDNARPSLALREQLNNYAARQGLTTVNYLELTQELVDLALAEDAGLQ
jgi:hypothetical protein